MTTPTPTYATVTPVDDENVLLMGEVRPAEGPARSATTGITAFSTVHTSQVLRHLAEMERRQHQAEETRVLRDTIEATGQPIAEPAARKRL